MVVSAGNLCGVQVDDERSASFGSRGRRGDGHARAHRGQLRGFLPGEHAGLFRALCLVTGSRQEAEDIMQIAFMKVFELWECVATMVHPQGFLYRIAINSSVARIGGLTSDRVRSAPG